MLVQLCARTHIATAASHSLHSLHSPLPSPPLPSPPPAALCVVRQSRFEPVSLNRIWHLNNVTTGWLGVWHCCVWGVALLCLGVWHCAVLTLLPPGSDSCPSPLPLGEGEGPEELFAHGQEAFERALHLWSQSLQAATRDGSPLGSQIKTVLEQAQTLQHTSFSFR